MMLKGKLTIFLCSLIAAIPYQLFANEIIIPFNDTVNWDRYITINTSDQAIKPENLSEKSALWNHVQFFANKNGKLTKKSMKKPHDLLGITKNVSYKISAIFNMLDRKNYPYEVDYLISIYNPASSGLWDEKGEFNEGRFQQLSNLAIEHNGNKIITKKIFNTFLKATPRDGSEKNVAATVTIIWPIKVNITWEQVTKASVDELFGYLATYDYKHNGKKEKAFTLEDLRLFYEHADLYMQKIIDRKHSQLKNQLETCPFS